MTSTAPFLERLLLDVRFAEADLVASVDEDGHIRYFVDTVEYLVGSPSVEITPENITELESALALCHDVEPRGSNWGFQLFASRKSGSPPTDDLRRSLTPTVAAIFASDSNWPAVPAPEGHGSDTDFIERVIRTVGSVEGLWFYQEPSEGKMGVSVMCSDVFAWGFADVEEITPENIGELDQTIADCRNALGADFDMDSALLVFCARVRQMRPQGAAYPAFFPDPRWYALLDAAGPRRLTGPGNPQEQP